MGSSSLQGVLGGDEGDDMGCPTTSSDDHDAAGSSLTWSGVEAGETAGGGV